MRKNEIIKKIILTNLRYILLLKCLWILFDEYYQCCLTKTKSKIKIVKGLSFKSQRNV